MRSSLKIQDAKSRQIAILSPSPKFVNLFNCNISSTCPHNMVNFSPLAAEISSVVVWCTPANFNGFRILALLLQRRRSTEANQTLHDVWPSPGLVHYVYIFGGSCPITEFCQVQNSLCVQVLHSYILAALLRFQIDRLLRRAALRVALRACDRPVT